MHRPRPAEFEALAWLLALCVCALTACSPAYGVTARSGTDAHVITASAIGPVRLNMTVDEARRAAPNASFSRTSDGDGAALISVALGKNDSLVLRAGEDDREAPIDWSRTIIAIETFSATFHTPEGVHPGSFVRDAIDAFGPVLEIVKSEIESREYIRFARQPATLRFRLDYTGLFPTGARRTTRFQPNAKIWSIAISAK